MVSNSLQVHLQSVDQRRSKLGRHNLEEFRRLRCQFLELVAKVVRENHLVQAVAIELLLRDHHRYVAGKLLRFVTQLRQLVLQLLEFRFECLHLLVGFLLRIACEVAHSTCEQIESQLGSSDALSELEQSLAEFASLSEEGIEALA